jgi:3-oxoacyl-[acyl-carrier protein] reductase
MRTVLVTGGSNGIGRSVAERFAAAGERIIITGRNPERLKQTTADLDGQDLDVRGILCDGSDPAQVAALVGELGPVIDVVVNNAGGNTDLLPGPAGSGAPPASLTDELTALAASWQANLDSNLFSAVLTTEAVAGLIPDGGSVISIGSIGAERGAGSYGAAKAALAAWNLTVSTELGPRGVTANVISAGYIAGTDFFAGRLTAARRDTLIAATHDKRPGRTQDIAETAFFLASAGARHITGQTIHVNGGAYVTR